MNNGQLRPVGNTDRCVAVQNNTNRNLRIENCTSGESRHRWKVDVASDKTISLANGRMETENTGTGRCVRAEDDWAETRLYNCTSPLPGNLGWTLEPVAAGSRTMQLRNVGTDACMEPQRLGDPSTSNKAVTWPCSGAGREAQSLVLTSSSQIRSSSGTTQCLWWSGDDGAWTGCSPETDYGKWTFDANGTIKSQANSNKCLRGALHTEIIKVVNCDANDANQRWIKEPVGATVNLQPRQIRNRLYNSCIDFSGSPNDGYDDPSGNPNRDRPHPVTRTVACTGQSRVNQGFLQLNNGQLRTMANLNYCLDSRNPSDSGAATAGAWIQQCSNVNQQLWELPGNQRLRTKALYSGTKRSLQAGTNGSPTSKAPDDVLADPDQDPQRWIIEDQPS